MFGNRMEVARRGISAGLVTGLVTGALSVGAAQADEAAPAEVLAVSNAFYAALNEMLVGTPVASRIAPLWSDAEGVTAQHPIGGRDTGLENVVRAFDAVASLASGGQLALEDQAIAVFGDTAVETGVETGTAVLAGEELDLEYRVTNVYTLTEAGWRMVHHHTDPSTPLIAFLAQLSN